MQLSSAVARVIQRVNAAYYAHRAIVAQGRELMTEARAAQADQRQARRGDADARAIANDSGIVIVGDDYNE